MSSKERIILIRPFAYIDLLGWNDGQVTVETKGKIVEARQLWWRFYWVGRRLNND